MPVMQQWTREQIVELSKRQYKSLRNLKMHGCDFSGLDWEKLDAKGLVAPYSNWSNTNVKFADFEGANLMFSKWPNSVIHRTNFKDAKLCDVDFSEAKDFFGVTLTMECTSFMGLKLAPGHWYGFLFYGLLMKPPTDELKEKLQIFFGAERYEVLRNTYANRRM
jgi:hypothetical protein